MYNRCQKCGKKLTDPESIKRGYGPECWGTISGQNHFPQADLTNYDVPGQMTIEDFLGGNGYERNEEMSKCGKTYNDRPALSKKDNKTEICPECGTMQALDDAREALGPCMTDQQWEQYKNDFIQRLREGQHGQNTL